jgi:chromosomal replication initiator protein DnaA
MVTDLRIPEGIIVRTAKGGPESLKGILADLKQYGFTGYLKVHLDKEIMRSIGYVVVEHGVPTMAIYEFEKSKPRELRRIYTGEKSLRFILEDSQDKTSTIEIHSRVGGEEFERRFPDAWIAKEKTSGKEEPGTPTTKDLASATGMEKEAPSDPISEGIEEWRRKGFNVDSLLGAREQGISALEKEFGRFKEDTLKLTQFEIIINNFPVLGHEREIAEIRSKLSDPSKIAEIESDIEFLQEKIRRKIQKRKVEEATIKQEMEKKKRDEKAADVYDLILKYQTDEADEGTKGEGTGCPVCGEPLGEDGSCTKCSASSSETPPYAKPLQKDLQFENFVAGSGAKFPFAVATAVAQAANDAYNPLLILGESGLGKTHLLSAIGNMALERDPRRTVVYLPADRVVETIESITGGEQERRILEELRASDLLLIDDMQFLAASGKAQEIMTKAIDHLLETGKQVVLASDRLPSNTPGLTDRFTARIQRGLTVDIQPPDSDTRMAIIKIKTRGKKLKLNDEMVAYIAQMITSDIRELEGALNKIMAFSTIMKMEIDMALISDILKPLAPVQETRKEIMKEVKILPGHCYLIEEEKPTYSNVLLRRKMDEGIRGLVITRMNPKRIRDEFDKQPEILWLTDRDSSQENTLPPSLEMMIHKIQEFMEGEEAGMVILDGIQYLISSTNFESVLRFLRTLMDEISESGCVLALSLSPETLKPQEISILEREMEVLNLT